MKIGEVIHGFELVSVTPVADLSAQLHLFRHQKTGAELLWTGRADDNMTFAVAFQTIPEDDTGVFHILEHSVLCGSDKYPVREPFVELLKGSMNTFLNAMTFPDKTVYPVSSRNRTDFRNLVGVYLDAVFHPQLYRNPNIFRQEGWHCEIDESGTPHYVGVVFGEMKGAFSGVDEVIQTGLLRKLYPNSCYGFCAGGDPVHIPELTYEQFVEDHRRFYHPSNARFFLDGSVDLETILADIEDGCLCQYERREPDFALTMQTPQPYSETKLVYAAAPGAEGGNQCHFAMGRITNTWQQAETVLGLEVLRDLLAGSNSAPLTRGVLEQGLGQDLRMDVGSGLAQCFVTVEVRNTSEEKLPGMRQALQAIVAVLVEKGIDREELVASLNRVEFRHRERHEPYGVMLAITAAESWMYGGDPALYLDTGRLFAGLREKLDSTWYEDLLRATLLGEDGLACLFVLPSETAEAESRAAEQASLQQRMAAWGETGLADIKQQQAKLAQWQQTRDTPEALATIPRLAVSDLSAEPLWTGADEETVAGVPVLRPRVATGGIVYLNLYFALPGLKLEQLPAVSLLANLLGELPTARHTAERLQREIKTSLGKMEFTVQVVSRAGEADSCVPCFHAVVSALESKAEEAVRLLREVLLETELDQPGKVREILQQMQLMQQQGLIMGGHQIGALRALSGQTAEDMAREYADGFTCYDWVRAAAADPESHYPAILETLRAVQHCFTAANLTLGVTGTMSPALVEALCGGFPAGEHADARLVYTERTPVRDAILVPAGIAYAVRGIDLYRAGFAEHGSLWLAGRLLTLEYLWNEVRVQGGAYGTGASLRPNGGVACWSFRDPNPARTLGVYQNAAAWLRKYCADGKDFSQLIIGTVSGSEPLQGANAESQTVLERHLRGITLEQKRRERKELLAATHADLLRAADLLEALVEKGDLCVIGSEALVSACGDVFDKQYRG